MIVLSITADFFDDWFALFFPSWPCHVPSCLVAYFLFFNRRGREANMAVLFPSSHIYWKGKRNDWLCSSQNSPLVYLSDDD